MTLTKKIRDLAVTGLVALAIGLSSPGCGDSKKDNKKINILPNIPDPAAYYCKELGYEHEIRSDPQGNQYGVCKLPNNIECEEWNFLEGKCGQQYTYCELTGGNISTTNQGCSLSQECAVCTLPSGTKCYEWNYFNEICP